MADKILSIVWGVVVILFGLGVTSKPVLDGLISLNSSLSGAKNNDKYRSFITIFLKIARIFFLIGGVVLIIMALFGL